MSENLKSIFIEEFLRRFDEAEQKKVLLSRDQQLIAERKSKKLNPIRDFLKLFVDQGVKVYHKDRYNKDILDKNENVKEEQVFKFYDRESSSNWAPGISIMFDHPAEVEIAIPNNDRDGALIIKVATLHPQSALLENSYQDIESACKALANFIVMNTTSVAPDYRKSLVEYERKNNLVSHIADEKSFLNRAPTAPPKTAVNANTGVQLFAKSYGKGAHSIITPPKEEDTKQ